MMLSPFEDAAAARALLERLRWPEGPRCPRCDASGDELFLIGGTKHSHRAGLYQCKRQRQQFSVTVGTPLERLRMPLSAWVRAAHAFSYQAPKLRNKKPSLVQLGSEIDVSYRTVLRIRDIIKKAAESYRVTLR